MYLCSMYNLRIRETLCPFYFLLISNRCISGLMPNLIKKKLGRSLPKGQLISKRLLEKIVWTKIATKFFDNFCPGGQIKKIKALSYINYGVFNVIKCLYFFDLTTRAEIVKFFHCYFGPNDDTKRTF